MNGSLYENAKDLFNRIPKGLSSVKWEHYLDIYEVFHKNLDKNLVDNILEIGVQGGGSLWLWKELFEFAHIVGVDTNEKCKALEKNDYYPKYMVGTKLISQTKIIIGDQADGNTIKKVIKQSPNYDIIIDDGGHKNEKQIKSFQMLFPILTEGGYYIIEDIQTSYYKRYGAGWRNDKSCVEYFKGMIDDVNQDFHKETKPNLYTRSVESIQFYKNLIVIKKGSEYSKAKVIRSGGAK